MNVAELSTTLVWGAVTAYSIALVSFTMLLARKADSHTASRADAVAGQGHDGRDAVAGQVPGGRDAVVAAKGVEAALHEATARAASSVPPPPATVSRGTTGSGGVAGETTRPKSEGIARATVWAGLLLHVGAVVTRTIAAERAPWANLYEFMLVGSLIAVGVLIAVERRRTIPFLGTAVMGIVVLFLAVAQVNFFVPADGVQPALQSYWLVIHVGVAVIATGVFTVGFVTSVLQLLRAGRARGGALASPRWGWLATTPGVGALESLAFRLNAVGFVLWSFTLVAGAIWAEHAWGRYWGWDPKEVWTFVIWIVYAGYLHARTTRGWMGRRAAWLVIVAYLCVVANFTLVNLLFPGLHTYANA